MSAIDENAGRLRQRHTIHKQIDHKNSRCNKLNAAHCVNILAKQFYKLYVSKKQSATRLLACLPIF